MLFLSEKLFEEKSEKDKRSAAHLLCGDRIAEDENRAENGEKLPCSCEDRTGQRAKPFDGQKDKILEQRIESHDKPNVHLAMGVYLTDGTG